jgi:hypothetical protein
MDTLNTPVPQVPETDNNAQFRLPDTTTNFAADEATLRVLHEEVFPVVRQTRVDRMELEKEWLAIRNMSQLRHDEGRKYYGRSDAYLPLWQGVERTLVSDIMAGLFPSQDYLGVTPLMDGDTVQLQEQGRKVKRWMQWELEKVASVKHGMRAWLAQWVKYGNAVMMQDFAQPKPTMKGRTTLRKLQDAAFAAPEFRPFSLPGTRIVPRNIFFWYMWPVTASSMKEMIGCFEDADIPRPVIEQFGLRKEWLNVEMVLSAATNPQHLYNLQELHWQSPNTANNVNSRGPLAQRATVTTIYTNIRLPAAAYADGEDKEERVPAVILACNDIPLRVTRNPYFHQRPPYHFLAKNTEPGFAYGFGNGKMVKAAQYLANDFANQMNDCGVYALNPVGKYNPGLMAGPMKPLAPGRLYPMSDVDKGLKFDRPDVGLIQGGLTMLQFWMQSGQDGGGAPPILSGLKAAVGRSGATGAQILQRNASTPLGDDVDDIETRLLVPMVYMAYVNAQQFRTDAVKYAIYGEQGQVNPEDLALDYMFDWLGSSQAPNKMQRASQAVQLLQAVMPLLPVLMQQGYTVDPTVIVRRVYDDSLGFPDFDQFIRKTGAPLPPGAMPDPTQVGQTGDRVRSALEQVTGAAGAPDMAPGEGEDFMEMRNAADQIAALAGGQQ